MKQSLFKYFFIAILSVTTCGYSKSLKMTNKILTSIGPTSITTLDVKKEMDRQIFMNDKKLFDNIDAIGSYYAQNWKHVLNKLSQDEALALEAKSLKYELPTHEINKKVTELFGDDPVETYSFLSMTSEEAKKYGERELVASHLAWFQVWSKSYLEATPRAIGIAYEDLKTDLAKKDKWTYQAMYLKGDTKEKVEETTSAISLVLEKENFSNLATLLDRINIDQKLVKVRVSKDITLTTNEMSPSLLSVLQDLDEGMVSKIVTSKKSNSYTGKLLQLKSHQKEPIPALTEVNAKLKNVIVNKTGDKLSKTFYTKLFKKYDANGLYGSALTASTFQPFAFEND